MFDVLTIKNFQGHKNSVLKLDPHMNVIVGETNSGKSSIVRALWWLAFGKPAGDSFVRKNTRTPAMVEVTCESGTLAKVRGTGINQYILNDEVLKGFGQAVPTPISDFLKLDEINFMRQLDPPFLLTKSGGEVAQYLNQIINLEIIDHSLGNIKRSVHGYAQNVANCEQNIEVARRSMEKYEWIEEAEERLVVLEKKQTRRKRLIQRADELQKCIELYDAAEQQVAVWRNSEQFVKRVEQIERLIVRVRKLGTCANALRIAISKYNQCKTNLPSPSYEKRLRSAITKLEKLDDERKQYMVECRQLSSCIAQIQKNEKYYRSALHDEQEAVKLYEANKPTTCPLCGQPWR